MRKLFISCPMRGLSNEVIAREKMQMKKIAEIVYGEEFEVVDSWFDIVSDNPILNLSESIRKMAEADVFIGIGWYDDYYCGCTTESDIARRYGIESMFIPEVMWSLMMPEAWEQYQKRYDNCVKERPTCEVKA